MYSININPIFLHFKNFQISYYALAYLAGFIISILILLSASRKKKISLSEGECYNLAFLGILSMIIGARIFHVLFWGFDYYSKNPIEIFYIWQGGMSFHGGLLALVIFGIAYSKIKKINFLILADIIAPLGIIAPAFTRLANFINQEIVGTQTSFPFCFNFFGWEGCRHPVQLYAAAGRMIFFFAILKISAKKFSTGTVFLISLFGVAVGRFFLDFIREDIRYFYLSAGQWLSLFLIIVSGYFLLRKISLRALLFFRQWSGNSYK